MNSLFWKNTRFLISEFIASTRKKNAIYSPRADIQENVDFTINNVGYMLDLLPNKNADFLTQKTMLEIGPGKDFGIALILADLGLKEVIVLDPFLVEWDETYHPSFYKALLVEAMKKFPITSFTSIQEVLKNHKHEAAKLTALKIGLENSSDIQDCTIDISISNACFEHFTATETAIKELNRITKKGGIGFHQIDLRDHRDFSKPLDFLAYSEYFYSKFLKMTDIRYGNRMWYSEYIGIFEKQGFSVVFKPDAYADENYLSAILQKAAPKFKQMPREIVGTLGGRYFIEKIS